MDQCCARAWADFGLGFERKKARVAFCAFFVKRVAFSDVNLTQVVQGQGKALSYFEFENL